MAWCSPLRKQSSCANYYLLINLQRRAHPRGLGTQPLGHVFQRFVSMGTCGERTISHQLTAGKQHPLCLRQEPWFEILLGFQPLKSYKGGNPGLAQSLYLKIQYLGIKLEC